MVKHQEVRHAWNLASLNLTPGAIVTFHAEARDFDDIKGPNLGKSREVRLRVLSDEDINRELDDARREIREETARIQAMQKQALNPVQDALRTIARTERGDKVNRDELKNAAMIQRQVANRINSPSDGLDQKVRRFLDDLKNFKIPNPDAQKQMEQMQRRARTGPPAEPGTRRAGDQPSLEEPGREPGQRGRPRRNARTGASGRAQGQAGPARGRGGIKGRRRSQGRAG